MIRAKVSQHPELAELVEKIWSRIGQQLENGAMTTIALHIGHRRSIEKVEYVGEEVDDETIKIFLTDIATKRFE
jgi:hypothetical protein